MVFICPSNHRQTRILIIGTGLSDKDIVIPALQHAFDYGECRKIVVNYEDCLASLGIDMHKRTKRLVAIASAMGGWGILRAIAAFAGGRGPPPGLSGPLRGQLGGRPRCRPRLEARRSNDAMTSSICWRSFLRSARISFTSFTVISSWSPVVPAFSAA